MRKSNLSLPEIAFIGGTRGMLGVGLGLLFADKLNDDQRHTVGWALLLLGVVTTAPILVNVLGKLKE